MFGIDKAERNFHDLLTEIAANSNPWLGETSVMLKWFQRHLGNGAVPTTSVHALLVKLFGCEEQAESAALRHLLRRC